MVVGKERQARNLQDPQWREPAGAWRNPDPRRRRLGALLLHRLSQSPSGLSEGVDRSPGELGVCRPAVLEGLKPEELFGGAVMWGGSILAAAFFVCSCRFGDPCGERGLATQTCWQNLS